MPPSKGIPALYKERFSQLSLTEYCTIKLPAPPLPKNPVTIEAQLPQCLQVDFFFSQGNFELLYPEKKEARLEPVSFLTQMPTVNSPELERQQERVSFIRRLMAASCL